MSNRIINILRQGQPQEKVKIQGWVRTKRELKEFTFIEVSDGSSLANLQVVLNQDLDDYNNIVKRLSTGASLSVEGVLVESPAKGQSIELHADIVTVYGECDGKDYPLQKKTSLP